MIVTQVSDNPRVLSAETIQDNWLGIFPKIKICPNPEEAIAMGLSSASSTDLICVTGSLYLVGQALKVFQLGIRIIQKRGI